MSKSNDRSTEETWVAPKSKPKALAMADLVTTKCAAPGCDADHSKDGFFVNASCHRGAPLVVAIEPLDECAEISCSVCSKMVVRIKIAR